MKTNQNEYHPATGLVVSSFCGHFHSDDFKVLCRQTIRLIKKHRAKLLLVDTANLEMMSQENRAWVQECWFPEATSAGLQQIAFIMPDNIFGRAVIKDANEKAVHEPLSICYFSNKEDALDWLLT